MDVSTVAPLIWDVVKELMAYSEQSADRAAGEAFRSSMVRRVNVGNALSLLGVGASVATAVTVARQSQGQARAAQAAAELQLRLAREAREHEALRSALEHARARELQLFQHELAQKLLDHQAVKDTYPFTGGLAATGMLRKQLDERGRGLPILLIPAVYPDAPADHPWRGLHQRLLSELEQYRDVVRIRLADRHFTWPHPGLLRYDLDGVPVIVLDVVPLGERLDIRLAATRLFPGELLQWLPQTTIDTVYYRHDHEWEPAERIRGVTERNLEFAARWIAFLAVRTVDTHHLVNRPLYRERTDAAAARANQATGRWPADHGLRLDDIRDQGYHLLHRSLRHHARDEPDQAEEALRAALRWFSGDDHGRLAPALRAAAQSGNLTAAHLELLRQALAAIQPRLDRHLANPRLTTAPAEAALPEPPPPRPAWLPRGELPPL
ncbi:hypothetical protein [Actinoallomurus iriomotensis]|uniref:Uncharacterized protein n=1 Tax=Actinoallomurus iriomotensis TaxID=478107 RepID=A0A9W6RU03_9ACTN|nr:hypothetical protein [Actinoallomurus iriomotensis]GLY80142.1 hypothetical protein Airi01_084090 [Actinoallomurus iriomotensis]